jgi:hypothetical protein
VPQEEIPSADASQPQPNEKPDSSASARDPGAALERLRKKMEAVANEFAEGKINRAQFNAIYGRYTEQRAIIERIIARDPHSSAWQRVASAGHTSFLRDHFEARCMYYVIYRLDWARPLMMGGPQQPDMQDIEGVLTGLNRMTNRPRSGLARKAMGNGQWLVLALGERTVTLALFNLEPSNAQLNRVRDLHNDFERANRRALDRGTGTLEKMVFPQRALIETS